MRIFHQYFQSDFHGAFAAVTAIRTKQIPALLMAGLFCACLMLPAAPVRAEELEQDAKEDSLDETLQLYAQSAVLMDADSGRVLYGKNPEDILPMASTTKIMTCILALEYGNPGCM